MHNGDAITPLQQVVRGANNLVECITNKLRRNSLNFQLYFQLNTLTKKFNCLNNNFLQNLLFCKLVFDT